MGKHHSVLISALVLAVLTFVVHTEAGAFANGDGVCTTPENDSDDCGLFGSSGSLIEFTATSADTCVVVAGSVPCTGYSYKYNGNTTNQLVLLIPKVVMTKFTAADAAAAGCSQLITNGSGDPTTNFGKNDLTHYVCRIAPNLGPGSTFTIHADPSASTPLSWQLRISSNNITASVINGPGLRQAPVAQTGASLLTSDGVTCSYTTSGGGVNLTNCPTGSVVPISQTKLCLPTISGPPTFTNINGPFTCETISFATDGCDIKTTGTDPCRWVGNFCVRY